MSTPDYLEEIRRLKQGIWDMARICGEDQDGASFENLTSDIVDYGINAVKNLREVYDECLRDDE